MSPTPTNPPPFCVNETSTLCITEPWQPRENGFIWFLNFILAFVFPIIPWEIFFFIPPAILLLSMRALKTDVPYGKINHLILFVTLFCAVYAGGAHPAGLIQAFSSLAGFDGICVVHPPPTATGAIGPPFKLYYGFGPAAWCSGLGLHVIFMCLIGWYFIFLLIKDRKKAKAAGNKILLPDPPVNELYLRSGLFFGIGGFSQALPYFFTFGYFPASSTGGYSKRPFSPGITECLAAWSWLGFGIFFLVKAIMGMKGTAAVSPATYEK